MCVHASGKEKGAGGGGEVGGGGGGGGGGRVCAWVISVVMCYQRSMIIASHLRSLLLQLNNSRN